MYITLRCPDGRTLSMSALTVSDRRFESHTGRKLVHGFYSPVSVTVEFNILSLSLSLSLSLVLVHTIFEPSSIPILHREREKGELRLGNGSLKLHDNVYWLETKRVWVRRPWFYQ
jgi:hypothetical protein